MRRDLLNACEVLEPESNRLGKSQLKRVVSMLARLIQRTDRIADGPIEYEYEYEYRDAEYE